VLQSPVRQSIFITPPQAPAKEQQLAWQLMTLIMEAGDWGLGLGAEPIWNSSSLACLWILHSYKDFKEKLAISLRSIKILGILGMVKQIIY